MLASAVHRPQLEYVALGHIHKYQTVREESPRVVYSGSLQRVDFSEEEDQKGFCVIDMDPKAPQGQRMTDFNFQPVKARPFVTVEVKVPPGEAEPTNLVLRSIARQDVAEAVVRVSINLPSEMEGRLIRGADIREALKQAHFHRFHPPGGGGDAADAPGTGRGGQPPTFTSPAPLPGKSRPRRQAPRKDTAIRRGPD